MPHKVLFVADPGIDAAFALSLALHDPQLDVVAVAATAGNVGPAQATRNVHRLIEHLNPRKYPRVGEALPVEYEINGHLVHGSKGLGGLDTPIVELHHPHPSDKLIVDQVTYAPGEVTVITLGPLTALARAIDRHPELPRQLRQLIILGGAWHEPGDAGAVAEFAFACDPLAARQVLSCGAPTVLIPLDTQRKMLFSPTELSALTAGEVPTCQLLRQMVPQGLGAMQQHFGIEGFYLQDVLGVCAVAIPEAFKIKAMEVDIETRGELTRGMSVFDVRAHRRGQSNVDAALEVDMRAVRRYLERILGGLSEEEE